MYRVLRNKYKWPPDVVDKISVSRLLKIYDETLEDFAQKKEDGNNLHLEDFE